MENYVTYIVSVYMGRDACVTERETWIITWIKMLKIVGACLAEVT